MCLVSYTLKWRPPEFALSLLSPSGLEFRIKGATLFRGPHGSLLDGAWHHVAVSVSGALGVLPFEVFVDGEPWEPGYAEFTSFLRKGLPLGGTLSVGQLEVNGRGTSFYVGVLSEVNLWDRALPEPSVAQLAASRTKWKFPGNVVSWSQLVAKGAGTVQTSTPSEDPVAAFVWFGLLRLRRKHSVLCADPRRSRVYIEPVQESCRQRAFWGLQLNGRLRNVADPASCLLVSPDGTALSSGSDCSAAARSSFRLLPDQRLQNLFSGLCLFQEAISTRLYLGKCSPQALHFALDRGVHCPHSRGWRSKKDKCLLSMLDVALEWSQALRFCQRFHGGSLLTLHGPEDLEELQVSVWTGLYSTGRNRWSWADGTPFHKALQRFIFSQRSYRAEICVLALTSGFLKAELCHRPHRWICQAPSRSDSYATLPGKSFYGALSADLSFSSLPLAKQQCTALGKGCNVVVSTATGHRLALGARLASLEDPAADPVAAVHVKLACAPGYSGPDCQAMCPHCEPGVSCNPLTGLCDGFLFYREDPATYTSLKCLPLGDWVFAGGSCMSAERYRSREEAEVACQGYLGAEVWKVPAGFSHALPTSGGLPWACRRPEEVELPSLKEKLLVSLQGSMLPQRRASLREARDACYLRKERCTGVLSLHSAYYAVAGTLLADSPGSGATLYVKAACSPGFCGDRCRKRCSPCLSTRTYNPLTGRCDGQLSCVRRFSPSCLQGLVNSRCRPGWWFWDGHCYHVEEHSRKDWQGAKEACQAYGRDVALLSLGSAKEKAWIRDMVRTGSWAGLNDADGDGSWTWAGGQAANLSSPWLAGTQLPTGECLEIRTQGEQNLAASPCSELKPWVCKGTWAPWSPCPSEPGWTPWNGSCYYWDPSSLSKWPAARQACQRFRKTELLSLTSSEEKEWVRSQFRGSFWTGLNDLQEESVFRWTTQEPLAQEVAQYLQDDLANGGLKDCVWFDAATGLLRDASCKEKRPYLCKGSEATDWFEKQPGRGVAGDPSWRLPSAESLAEAKQECLLERSVCAAVLQTGTGFYLVSSLREIISRPDSTLYALTICAEGFSGPDCRRALAATPRPACDCSGKFQTTAKKEASTSHLGPEELALIAMVQFKVSHSLNLTVEDERDRGSASKILYDPRYP
ncbi:hypothetical protein lerEdw1_015829 [Lerista edwardsae]|nr:hypothetical protein lerEdw1_015829 [Lerista edwardsae]